MSWSNFDFIASEASDIRQHCSIRSGETKLGERISTVVTPKTRYVLLGIQESIGPMANNGLEGAQHGFPVFLKRFVNMQSNRFLSGEELAFIGTIKQKMNCSTVLDARLAVENLDDLVVEVLAPYTNLGLIPIVIGGGHNNAFPLIKVVSLSKKEAISVVNLDPHADCRSLEGRHSGNSFSYATHFGILKNYAVLGLHKAYNSEFLLSYLEKNAFFHSFFDDYIANKAQFHQDVAHVGEMVSSDGYFGLELDMDAIHFMPTSAFSPSGFSLEEARYYTVQLAKYGNCAYFHLPEGAPTNEYEEKVVGKSLAYLVHDFMCAAKR